MGVNYYFVDKEMDEAIKKFEKKHPYLHIEEPKLHICKLSAGWKPLFNSNIVYSSFKEIEDFADKSTTNMKIIDSCGTEISWEDLKAKIDEKQNNKDNLGHVGNNSFHYYNDEDGYEFINGNWC